MLSLVPSARQWRCRKTHTHMRTHAHAQRERERRGERGTDRETEKCPPPPQRARLSQAHVVSHVHILVEFRYNHGQIVVFVMVIISWPKIKAVHYAQRQRQGRVCKGTEYVVICVVAPNSERGPFLSPAHMFDRRYNMATVLHTIQKRKEPRQPFFFPRSRQA